MPMRFKIDVVEALRDSGYNSNRIRIENILSQSTLQKFRHGEPVGWGNIETLCELLHMQPGDLLEYVPDSISRDSGELE